MDKSDTNIDLEASKASEGNASTERRSDFTVRSAINDMQAFLFDPEAQSMALRVAVKNLVQITNSDQYVGFIADQKVSGRFNENAVLLDENNQKYPLKVYAQAFVNYLEKGNHPIVPTIFNTEKPTELLSIIKTDQDVSSLLFVPLFVGSSLRAIILLSKQNNEYDSTNLDRIVPVLGSLICTIRSADTVSGDLDKLESKIHNNQFLKSLIYTGLNATLAIDENGAIVLSNPGADDLLFALNDNQDLEQTHSLLNFPIENFVPYYEDLFLWSNQSDKFVKNPPRTSPQVWHNQTIFKSDGSTGLADISVFRYVSAMKSYTVLQLLETSQVHHQKLIAHSDDNHLLAIRHMIPVGVLKVNRDWQCTFANEKWIEESGLSESENLGSGWMHAFIEEDRSALFEALKEGLQTGDGCTKDVRLITPLGQVHWFEFSARVTYTDEGQIEGFLATATDINNRIEFQNKLRQVAEYDPLTKLVNRGLLIDRLQQAFYLSEREESSLCLMFLDLDGFKQINDKLGHDHGDELLVQVANRLQSALRKNDTVARFGGDEFVVLLGHDQQKIKISNVAEKLINTISQPYNLMGTKVKMTTSIGIATGSSVDSSPSKLLKQADSALYLAKNHGKNAYQIYDSGLNGLYKQRDFLLNQLKRGVSQANYQLSYQPIFELPDNKIISAEAFISFTDVNSKEMSFDEISPLLDDSGIIHDVGDWAINEICRTLSMLIKQRVISDSFTVSINVTQRQLLDERLHQSIVNASREFKVPAEMIAIEFEERFFEFNSEKLKQALLKLHATGVKVIIDQFGSAQASLNELVHNYFDGVKICSKLTSQIVERPQSAIILKAIAELAAACRLNVVAEDIASPEVKAALLNSGIKYLQGDASSTVISKTRFLQLLNKDDEQATRLANNI